jgi:hypothetical protein
MNDEQYAAGKRLLSAVVSLAILDACQKPIRRADEHQLSDEAESALEFLFGDTRWCDLYLSSMGIDPGTFRRYLISTMERQKGVREIKPEKQKIFNLNYHLYRNKHGRMAEIFEQYFSPKKEDC